MKEVETNQRPAPVYANRTAVYVTPMEFRVRFLFSTQHDASPVYDGQPVRELCNVAEIALSPHMVKPFVADLLNCIRDYEARMGTIPAIEHTADMWLSTANSHGRVDG